MAMAPPFCPLPSLPSSLSLHPPASSSYPSSLRLSPLVVTRDYPFLHSGSAGYRYHRLGDFCLWKPRQKDLSRSHLLDSGGVLATPLHGLASPAAARDASRLKVDARASGRSNRFRRRRRLQRVDPQLEESKRVPRMQFLEQHKRLHKETGRQVLVDVEHLLNRSSNRFGLVLDIAEQATEYLDNNPEEALVRKPILKVIGDKINEEVGMKLRDAYVDEGFDEWQENIW